MLSCLLPVPGSPALDVGSNDRAHDAGLEQRGDILLAATVASGRPIEGNPGEEGMGSTACDAEIPVEDASTVDYRANPLIIVLDDALLETGLRVEQIETLVDSVISNGPLNEEQVAATQLQIDSWLEEIDRKARDTRFQGVPLLTGLLDSSGGGLLLDVDHHDPITHPTRIYVPSISTATLGGTAGRLFELGSGRAKALDSDAPGAGEVVRRTLKFLHEFRLDLGPSRSYHGTDVVLLPDRESGGYRLTEIQSDSPIGITSLAEAESVLISPDETFVCLSGFQDGSTASFRWDETSETLSFLERLGVSETGRENPLLVEAADGVAEIRSVLQEIETVVSTVREADNLSDAFLAEQQAQVDYLLDTIDDIARTASYDGTLLLDGSLGILVENVDDSLIHDLTVYQAALEDDGPVDVHVNVIEPATQPMLFYAGESLRDDVVLEVGSAAWCDILFLTAGMTIVEIAAAVNLTTATIGLEALVDHDGSRLVFRSVGFGHDAYVSIWAIEGTFPVADSDGVYTGRRHGTSANVEIGGLPLVARGFDVTFTTAALDLRFTPDETVAAAAESTFQITGDGLRYLAGTQDDPQHQTRLGIPSLESADLGGRSGRLSDLHSAANALLGQDTKAASSIVKQAVNGIRELFVRLDVLARGESAVTVMVLSGREEVPKMVAVPDAHCSKRTTPLLAAADNGLASISVMLGEMRDAVPENIGALSRQQINLKQLQIDMLLQAIQRTATSSTTESVVPLDGSLQLTAAGQHAGHLHDIEVNHVDFDGLNPFNVDVEVIDQATKGKLHYAFGAIAEDIVLEIGGKVGSEVFSFSANSTIGQVAASVNLVSDALGVRAEVSDNVDGLDFIPTDYGSSSFVEITMVKGTFPTTDPSGAESTRSEGTDANVHVNGIPAAGKGLRVGLNHPQLGLSFVLDETVASGSDISFTIPPGGARFESPSDAPIDSVPALGILDARPIGLGGLSGALDELRFNGDKSLLVDAAGALGVVDEAISSVIRQRSRLAIFERDVLGIAWPPDEPPTTFGVGAVTVSENSADTAIDLFAAFEDDRDPDAGLTYRIIENTNPNLFDATSIDGVAGTLTLDYAPDDEGTAELTIQATDRSGQFVTTTFNVIVNNAVPTVDAIDGPSSGVRCQPLAYAASFVDPGVADTHTASVDWGDGSPVEPGVVSEVGGSGTVTASHAYAATGVYTVRLTVEDDDGGQTAVQTQVTVQIAAMLDDPNRLGRQALFVGGTPENDRVSLFRYRRVFVRVYVAAPRYWQQFALQANQRIYVYAGAGNDYVRLYANVSHDAVVFGGPGNDRLFGARGNDILDGGAGNDRLYGNSGNDILLGGDGNDRLHGHSGRDLLIGGSGRDYVSGVGSIAPPERTARR